MKERIYYSNKEFDSSRRGVQAIVQPDRFVGWYVESHGDYYIKKADKWRAADFDGLITELKYRKLIKPTIGLVHEVLVDDEWVKVDALGFHAWLETLDWLLFGETIDNDRFQEIFQQALADADFGRKNGYLPGEYVP